jgi:hypothetical protein
LIGLEIKNAALVQGGVFFVGRRRCWHFLGCIRLARLYAGLAGGGAGLAVVVLVLGAFGVALFTNLDAFLEHVLGVVGAAGNEGGGEAANVGAVAVEADAGHHHLGVFFVEAGVGAELAGGNAAAEGIENGLVVLAGAGGGHVHRKGLVKEEVID